MKKFYDLKILFNSTNPPEDDIVRLENGFSLQVFSGKIEGNIYKSLNNVLIKFRFLDDNRVQVNISKDSKISYFKPYYYTLSDNLTALEDIISHELLVALLIK